jgi:hypothetical protein
LGVFGEQVVSDLSRSSANPSALAEPLTEREGEVLLLLLEGHRIVRSLAAWC